MQEVFVVSLGNVFDGLTLRGPFKSFDEASRWAEENANGELALVSNLVSAEP